MALLLPRAALPLIAGFVLWAGPAYAHGGRVTPLPVPVDPGPNGTGPTNYPPYPAGPPVPTAPTGGPLPPQAPTTSTPTSGQPRTPNDPRGRGARLAQAADWRDWWDANADALRATRPRRMRVTTDSALSGLGSTGAETSELPSRRVVETTVLPALRAILASTPARDADTLAAATIALGKATNDPADVLRIVAVLENPALADVSRETAALALGCLRRTKAPPAFDGRFYDRVRTTLFDTIDDRTQRTRTRCFAALALGLLGDQQVTEDDAFAKDGRLAIRGIWTRLDQPGTDDEIAVALLVALSLQDPAGVPTAVRVGLRRLAVSGDAGRRRRGSIARAHALLALARLGDGDGVGISTAIVKSSGQDPHVRRSALLALGLPSIRLDGPARAALARTLVDHARSGEPNTAGLALLSAGRLLGAQFAEGLLSTDAIELVESISDAADHGAFAVRPFAALAIGMLARPAGKALDDGRYIELRDRVLARLRATYADEGEDPVVRAAFSVSLGIARDGRARPLLEANVAERHGSPTLATYACAGLGLLGDAPDSTRAALRRALADRSDDGLRREAARALGMIGDTKAVGPLIAELEEGGSDHVLARAVLALGAIQDVSAVAPLCALASRKGVADSTRALACAGLGLLSDFELVPSLSHLGIDSNYLARTDALSEALSLL